MRYILEDGPEWHRFLPLTFTRAMADIRVGMYSLKERWEEWLGAKTEVKTQKYLSEKYRPIKKQHEYLCINPAYLPDEQLIQYLLNLGQNQCLLQGEKWIAKYEHPAKHNQRLTAVSYPHALVHLENPWDVFLKNDQIIRADFDALKKKRKSLFFLDKTNFVFQEQDIFIEEGACIQCATLNAGYGPIYIGKNAQIMEGAHLRGPIAIGQGAQVNMGAKIYGATSIGPFCKVGGEINNSIFFSYSNKSHEGFLGQSVIGAWCNLGAGTTSSNLKNNYSRIKLWSYREKKYIPTHLQFCGVIMGDHCRTAINTSLNTGTICGTSAQIFGHGFPPKHIRSFCWGGIQKTETYDLKKACQSIARMMKRRNISLNQTDKKILEKIFDMHLEDQISI